MSIGLEVAVKYSATSRNIQVLELDEISPIIGDKPSYQIPMEEPEEQGPSFPKPWYYRPEFMIPMFIFWPAGSLLAIRSPWNSNVMLGGVAWMFIMVGGIMGVRWLNDGVYQPIFTFYVPGVLLTLVTQVQWASYKKQMSDEEDTPEEVLNEPEESSPPRPSARRRRRNPKAGRTKD